MSTLLLLHGLGATGSAWGPLRAVLDWDGPVLSPDLPGHGRAPHLTAYDVASVAAALQVKGSVAALGHSFGGAVALALASGGYGATVTSVVGLGIKAVWSAQDVARFAELSTRPPRVFSTREKALERHLAMARLVGQPPADHLSGVVEVEGGWQLALDPAVLAQQDPDLVRLVGQSRAPVLLLRGEHDPMVGLSDLPGNAADLRGLGHNAHVEDPAAVWAAVRGHLTR